jgi:hypothetical protein
MAAYEPIPGSILATLTTAALVLAGLELLFSMMGDLRSCDNFKSISPDAGTSSPAARCGSQESAKRARCDAARQVWALLSSPIRSHVRGEDAVRSYRITLRDRETQTVVGYYDGSWTTDRRRALVHRKREVAEAHAARMRERCPRNADLIKLEELDAAD